MDTSLQTLVKSLLILLAVFAPALHAQEVQTLELATSTVHPINARLGTASLIQVPLEIIATNVGDPASWLVEKTERLVSIKPTQVGAQETNLAIVTRQGTLSFAVKMAGEKKPFTQIVRIIKIIDDSKPLPPLAQAAQESLSEIIIRELKTVQNYHALKTVNASEIKEVEQFTVLDEEEIGSHRITLLETFRFRDSRHLVLHFIVENKSDTAISFDHRKIVVALGQTLLSPVAVSLGCANLYPGRRSENFIVLDGSNGLSHRQIFKILLVERGRTEN